MAALPEPASRSPRLPWPAFFLGFVLCLVPVFGVGGFRNGFAYWNAAPVIVAFAALAIFGRTRAAQAFAVVTIGFTEFVHFAWLGDWGGTATGSSTAGLIFIFLPFWSIFFGLIAAGAVRVLSHFKGHPNSPSIRTPHRPVE